MFLIVSTSCDSCGGESVVRLMSTNPTLEDIKEVGRSLGGMWCIKSKVVEIELDGDPVEVEEEDRWYT